MLIFPTHTQTLFAHTDTHTHVKGDGDGGTSVNKLTNHCKYFKIVIHRNNTDIDEKLSTERQILALNILAYPDTVSPLRIFINYFHYCY